MPNYNAVARQGPMKGVLGWTGWMDKKRGEGLGRGGRVGGGGRREGTCVCGCIDGAWS